MKLISTIISLVAPFSVASVDNVRFNTFYDNPQTSLNNIACSNGRNGTITKRFPTFGSLPSFPDIGAAKPVGAWNSPLCWSCRELKNRGNCDPCVTPPYEGLETAFDIITPPTQLDAELLQAVSLSQICAFRDRGLDLKLGPWIPLGNIKGNDI
ncbi:Cerato-platanin-domain-containing protein [Lactarius psammicola]|nr:Cerato-platanin-domain-containing protein [Lactarius psammicola]